MRKRKKRIKGLAHRFKGENSGLQNYEETEKARKVLISLCKEKKLELVHIERRNEPKGKIFRVYIDKPGGVTLDDCANLSRELSDILDVEWENCGFYHLEVSSPGIERPLGKLDDFVRFHGKKAKIKLVSPLDKRKDLCGRIMGVSQNMIEMCVDNKVITLEYSNVARARLMVLDGDN